MKNIIVALVLLCALAVPREAVSQALPSDGAVRGATCAKKPICNPANTADRTVCGPELRGSITLPNGATGEYRAWWWKTGQHRDAQNHLIDDWCPFQWTGLDKFFPKTARDYVRIAAAVEANASDLTTGIMDAIDRFSVVPAAGTQDAIDKRRLEYRACRVTVLSPPDSRGWRETPVCRCPTGWVVSPDLSDCAPTTTPPALSPYIVTSAPAYAVVNGKRSVTRTGTAVVGQPCDCAALQIIEFNVVRYCASPSITGITGPAVTACRPRPQ